MYQKSAGEEHRVHDPVRNVREVAPTEPRRLQPRELLEPQQRPEEDAAGERLVGEEERFPHRVHRRPVGAADVERLGVDAGLGEVGVLVVLAMRLVVERKRQPQPERRHHHRPAQPSRGGEERVDRLVLQREVPGDEVSADRRDHPPRQARVIPDERCPAAVQHAGDEPRRAVVAEEEACDRAHDRREILRRIRRSTASGGAANASRRGRRACASRRCRASRSARRPRADPTGWSARRPRRRGRDRPSSGSRATTRRAADPRDRRPRRRP